MRNCFKNIGTIILLSFSSLSFAVQTAWYVSFSGESANPIQNIYALSVTSGTVTGEVLPRHLGLKELRNMTLGSDGNFYVVNSHNSDSRILQFGPVNADGITRDFLGNYVTTATSGGLVHPYGIGLSPTGDVYVSNQDTNIVLGFYGPLRFNHGSPIPLSPFLQAKFSTGTFFPGTFIAAFSASIPPSTSVPANEGGLSGDGSHSVRGFTFAPNHTLYVSDELNDRVRIYDSTSGVLLGDISDGSNHIKSPDQIIFYLNDGMVYIACPGSNRIIKYDPGTQTFNTFIHDSTHLDSVSGIAFGEDGNFYAGDRTSMSIYKYDGAGNFLGLFAGPFTDAPEGLMPLYATVS